MRRLPHATIVTEASTGETARTTTLESCAQLAVPRLPCALPAIMPTSQVGRTPAAFAQGGLATVAEEDVEDEVDFFSFARCLQRQPRVSIPDHEVKFTANQASQKLSPKAKSSSRGRTCGPPWPAGPAAKLHAQLHQRPQLRRRFLRLGMGLASHPLPV
jgi:hypothetical protein